MTTFRAKARAVELLGKGQIADLPTAITELWKNGYDAYATVLECKLFLETYKDNKKPLFLLSDNGFGMSHKDILDKWFVLGTDSKARGERITAHFNLPPRPPMGEKGIGRLSVAYLGSQMLMLSKKMGEEASAVLLDWRILDNYNFYLSDLTIPTFTFNSLNEFASKLKNAKTEFKSNFDLKLWTEQVDYRNLISAEWDEIEIAEFLNDEVIKVFCENDYHGTSFLIFSPIEFLTQISDSDRAEFKNNDSLNYIRASISGLHNDLKNPEKDFETHFYVLDSAGRYDLIDDFLTQEDMREADHWLKGEFDENGFFTGELRVYNKRLVYKFRPNRPPGKTSYGPIKIEWGSIEGNPSASLLNADQYAIVNDKLKTFGGLYIYRDNFRVLPYGRTEADFLDFEKRRSSGAGYYFFSHRRFIGYIDITRKENFNLIDKAGREGFIQNKAYREFKEDLTEFFVDIAVRYMRRMPEGDEVTLRQSQIDEIKEKYDKQLKAAKKKNSVTKKSFIEQLNENLNIVVQINSEIINLEGALKQEASNLEINYNNYNRLLSVLDFKKGQLRSIKLQKPKGIEISAKQTQILNDYQKSYFLAEDQLRACAAIVQDTRARLNVENLKLEFRAKFDSHQKNIEKIFSSFQNQARNSFDRINKLLNSEKDAQIDSFISGTEFLKITLEDDKEDIASKIKSLDILIEEQNNSIDTSISGFINHLTNLQIDVDDDFLTGWYQEQNENLLKKLSDYEELAQLGISIEIIDHQFNVMYSQMSDAVKSFANFSQKYPEMKESFKYLNTAFQHLEGNYKLLKPLYRTSRRTREIVTGEQIEKYVRDFFANEFERYRIDFSVNEGFRLTEFFTYDSIIKPVFLNLINNANYWLIPAENRRIRIEEEQGKVLIMNSGERIDDSYLEDIFTLFFTRKRDGRGIGLYLAKKNLNSIGYDICASNSAQYNKFKGACFVITKIIKPE